jgi:hypothetical protein
MQGSECEIDHSRLFSYGVKMRRASIKYQLFGLTQG